ncbi:MAG TPA: hemolysin family protein [Vicinamibacterales bacterium]|nr:hemolysin family protein [Vicinamibacterales bacterium]
MGGVWFELGIILLLVVANGLFAMSEISVVAARKIRLQQRAEDGDRRARLALDLARRPEQFLSTVQVGITLIGVLAGAYGGATLAAPLADALADFPVLAPYAQGAALGLVVASITALSIVIGELVPKSIGLRYPESIASRVAGPMMMLSRIGGPVVNVLTAATNFIMRSAGFKPVSGPSLTEEEIRAVISEGAESGVLEAAEESIVQRVFQLGDQRVAAIMTPRVDIEWVDVGITTAELRDFLMSHTHTEFVVCDDNLDHVLGTVRAAELLPAVLKGGTIDLRTLLREPLFVPDSMAAFKLLEAFRSSHRHLALVLDEFGAVEGLVSVTDLLEGLVGALPGDPSEAQGEFVRRDDNSWLVEGSAHIDEVVAKFGFEQPFEEVGAYQTLAGLVMARLGRIPRTADSFDYAGFRFEVVDMDGRRVDQVMVTRVTSLQSPPTAPPSPASPTAAESEPARNRQSGRRL